MDSPMVACDKFKFSVARQDEWLASEFWTRVEEYCTTNCGTTREIGVVQQAFLHVRKSVYHSGRPGKDTVHVFSFEATGLVAEFLFPLMPGWALGYLTYLHVKTYHESIDPEEFILLKNAATNGPMFRQITLFSPQKFRRDGGDIATLPGIRIGHAKSDRQVIMYQQGGQPLGTETRLSGDKLKTVISFVKDSATKGDIATDEVMTALMWIAHGEGNAYINRLKQEAGMSDTGVFGPIMGEEDLATVWGKIDYLHSLGQAGLYDSDGFPLEPKQGRAGPVKGRLNKGNGAEFRLTNPLDDVPGEE